MWETNHSEGLGDQTFGKVWQSFSKNVQTVIVTATMITMAYNFTRVEILKYMFSIHLFSRIRAFNNRNSHVWKIMQPILFNGCIGKSKKQPFGHIFLWLINFQWFRLSALRCVLQDTGIYHRAFIKHHCKVEDELKFKFAEYPSN